MFFDNEVMYDSMVLEMSIKHKIIKQSLNKLTKTNVLFPQDIESMLDRIGALYVLSKLFFGNTSLLVQNLQVFVKQCYNKKLLLKTSKHLDEQFIPKFLYSIDDRINKWLTECVRAKDISDTSIELINFNLLLTDVQLNRFVCYLPGNIRKISKKNDFKEDDNVVPPTKRVKSDNGSTNTRVVNSDIVDEWKIKDNEDWDTCFKGKSKEGPKLTCGTYPCITYHVKGFCWSDCSFRASHKKLNGDDTRKTCEFIKKLRDAQ